MDCFFSTFNICTINIDFKILRTPLLWRMKSEIHEKKILFNFIDRRYRCDLWLGISWYTLCAADRSKCIHKSYTESKSAERKRIRLWRQKERSEATEVNNSLRRKKHHVFIHEFNKSSQVIGDSVFAMREIIDIAQMKQNKTRANIERNKAHAHTHARTRLKRSNAIKCKSKGKGLSARFDNTPVANVIKAE